MSDKEELLTFSLTHSPAETKRVPLYEFNKNQTSLKRILGLLDGDTLSRLYNVEKGRFEIFEVPDLNVIKISFPRTHIQGSRLDRDMHGAQFAELLNEMELPDNF